MVTARKRLLPARAAAILLPIVAAMVVLVVGWVVASWRADGRPAPSTRGAHGSPIGAMQDRASDGLPQHEDLRTAQPAASEEISDFRLMPDDIVDIDKLYEQYKTRLKDARRRGSQDGRLFSTTIYSWAKEKTTQQLIQFILANPGDSRGVKPSEDAAVAVWALALHLKNDRGVIEVIRDALLRADIPGGAALSLIGLLARCGEDRALDCLLELTQAQRPQWFTLAVMTGLVGGGCRRFQDFEEYLLEDLDPRADTYEGRLELDSYFMPVALSPRSYRLREDIAFCIARYCARQIPACQASQEVTQMVSLLGALVGHNSEMKARQFQTADALWYPDAINALLGCCRSFELSADGRQRVLAALAADGSIEAQRAMLESLEKDTEWRVRGFVAHYHVEYYRPELRALAEMALWRVARKDLSDVVRENALFSLPRTQEVKAEIINFLMRRYSGAIYSTRLAVIDSLVRLGEAALPTLEQIAATDTDEYVRREAANAITNIRGGVQIEETFETDN